VDASEIFRFDDAGGACDSRAAEIHPGGLWSLRVMLDRHAYLFSATIAALTSVQHMCLQVEQAGTNDPLPDGIIELSKKHLIVLRRAYIINDLSDQMGALDRLEQTLHSPFRQTVAFGQQLRHFLLGLRDLLEQEYYFHLDPHDVPLYRDKGFFSAAAISKFPLAIEDIEEAGKCLALQQSTACVFHLMRVMELGVQGLAKRLRVTTIDLKVASWNDIANHTNAAINKLPAKRAKEKSRKANLGTASANLNAVRIAWRNEVMHPKQTYTRTEAHDVFNAVRAFMNHLADLL
jgi:hypothetical protein